MKNWLNFLKKTSEQYKIINTVRKIVRELAAKITLSILNLILLQYFDTQQFVPLLNQKY